MDTLLIAGGLALLAVSGEALVRGAARLAAAFGVPTLVIGLTVVAFGTSAPEAAVTIYAGLTQAADIAVGNVVGSNIANLLLILGVAAALQPIPISRSIIRWDGPVMLVSCLALGVVMVLAEEVTRSIGMVFVLALIVYTVLAYRLGGEHEVPPLNPHAHWLRSRSFNVVLVVLGIIGLVVGARLLVTGGTGFARLLGVSEHIIGLTIVAVGTSLPELATTIVAARRQQPDIALGNIVGSNIFNVLFVTGLTAVISPLPITRAIAHFDGAVMMGACVIFCLVGWTNARTITRRQGWLLLGLYAGYLLWTGAHAMPPHR
ncbi:MAG: calcium/sodium antiporter [Phycisphaerales bacterium]|nr:calcium/sodium antiporter [Phycisphaerales bacterium]